MASIIEFTVDLKSYNPFDAFLSPGNKELFIDKIINYDRQKIVYIATLRKTDFIDRMESGNEITRRLEKMYGILKFEVLKKDDKLGIYRVMVVQKLPQISSDIIGKYENEMFLTTPLALTKEGLKVNLIVMKGSLSKIRRFLDKSGLRYRVQKIKNSIGGEAGTLTQEEKFIFQHSFESGYFDVPRRRKSDEICRDIGTSKSSFSRTIRRIERKGMEILIDLL